MAIIAYVLSYILTKLLQSNPHNARTHSKKQIAKIAASIEKFGFTSPIVCDEHHVVLAGHGRLQAALKLGLETVPTITVSGLSDAQKRALMLADNKIADQAGWDSQVLNGEFDFLAKALPEFGLDLSITGFEFGEIDSIMADHSAPKADPLDACGPPPAVPVTRKGDVWKMHKHRLSCGDARNEADRICLMVGQKARMVFVDPPYNVPVAGHVQGRGKIKHAEFAFASGEMSEAEFIGFLTDALREIASATVAGAIVFVCMDWRHVSELISAGRAVFGDPLNMIVWNKTSPGQGSFYRSQHELILVFKNGDEPHLNAIQQGKFGRNRSNVWTYPGANGFHKNRARENAMHPTVKPVAMVADAMRDCSGPNDIVLDTFMGSGTTLMAAEKIGRRAYGIEFEPGYVDVAVKRWQDYTGRDAILEATGQTFEEVRAAREARQALFEESSTFSEMAERNGEEDIGSDERNVADPEDAAVLKRDRHLDIA